MGYFPFFMEIADKKGVIVGGGKVAARKVEKLLPFGPNLMVIAPQIDECIRNQERQQREAGEVLLLLKERAFCMEDLEDADFVIAAGNPMVSDTRIEYVIIDGKVVYENVDHP